MTKAQKCEATTTQEELLNYFTYEEETGFLYWKNPTSRRVKAGERAGCLTKHGYYCVMVKGVLLYAHRVIWCMYTGKWPKFQLDHKDRNRANNRMNNLREVTNQKNSLNKGVISSNTSGTTGVYLNTRGKYTAQITVNGKTKSLGSFSNINDAISAREEAFNLRKTELEL